MRVLVVEDELKMAGLIQRGLRAKGHAVDVATRGEEALRMAQACGYNAIVLDVMLPGTQLPGRTVRNPASRAAAPCRSS